MKPAAPVTSACTGPPYRRVRRRPMIARTSRLPWVAVAAVALLAAQLAVRSVVAFGGYFYWDDLILVSRAGSEALLAPAFLFDDHDGHLMPAAFLLGGAIIKAAPLNWLGPALSLVALQAVASASLLRTLHLIVGWRPVLLVPWTFALFTPLAVPGFAWWAAALNSLPMLAALAWVCGDAILLVRTGARRYAVTGTLAYLGGLVFFEKAAVIPVVALVLTGTLAHVRGESFAAVWRRGRALWYCTGALTAAWVVLYLAVVNQRRWSTDWAMTGELLWRSITHGIVPGLVGGPWRWQRWAPASPWAVPGPVVMTLGWLALVALLAVSVARKRRLAPVWAAAAGYAVACQIPIYLMRSSRFTALELAQALRYLPDLVVVAALLAAVAFCAPNRAGSGWLDAGRRRTLAVTALAAAFVASSLYSTATFCAVWRDNPTEPYLRNAVRSLALAHTDSGAPLLDQEVDPMVLQPIMAPSNRASHLFALLRERPEFASATTEPRMFDRTGTLVDAQVTWVRSIIPGPVDGCGYFVQPDLPARVELDGPLLPAQWTAELNYLANADGAMTLALSDGPAVKVPVRPGLNRVFVRLPGAGDAVEVHADTAALSLCIAAGPVGYLAPR
ncbi:hypothetical protein H7J77_03190 [Mycolicibacillus parakoreensis]|uniref:Transmembrane protein n=1 Tax=Mycolicibacillus parakoreensis TaxID=1069221 RepID=A0ABY3U3F5_9MYCO|nr:hypothetical protein [Mycolicibacillus parakoreensis]MCV7314555.1 hypothetical protein [Mycolicibacillus parakoreensis]ULN53115.1 hypothetical protein MIU77_01730 [Mycolicibacillus parakoreensis]